MAAVSAKAESGDHKITQGYYEYLLKEDGTAELTRFTEDFYGKIEQNKMINELRAPGTVEFNGKNYTVKKVYGFFAPTTKVKSIVFEEGIEEVVDFSAMAENVSLPSTVKVFRGNGGELKECRQLNIAQNNPYLSFQDGMLYDKVKKTALWMVQEKKKWYFLKE